MCVNPYYIYICELLLACLCEFLLVYIWECSAACVYMYVNGGKRGVVRDSHISVSLLSGVFEYSSACMCACIGASVCVNNAHSQRQITLANTKVASTL